MNAIEMLFGLPPAETLEREREALLKKAYALEVKWARKLVHKKDYHELKSAIHQKIVLIDLEKSVEEAFGKILDAENLLGKLSPESGKKIAEIISQAEGLAKKIKIEKGHFARDKKDAGHFQKILHSASSKMLDLEHEIGLAARKIKKEKARQIMFETQMRLHGIGEDVSGTVANLQESTPWEYSAENEIKLPGNEI